MSQSAYLRRQAAAEYLREKFGVPCSPKTLAKLACIGGGPIYRRFGRIPLYLIVDLEVYATAKISKPVKSTSEYGAEPPRGCNLHCQSPALEEGGDK
jgi:hypothetical protein